MPTTTIGSFPQTTEVRRARASFRKGEWSASQYETFLKEETKRTIQFQEEIGLDVLVHGEFERNDMVEYFGELLDGFAFTSNGWVQSYGTRCVKPPIIFGDVQRPRPMTVDWIKHAQSLTDKPMKGMLTGPVTILCWSFVRDDQPSRGASSRVGILYAVILMAAKAAQFYFQDAGLYAASALAGLADVDAITLSLARMSQDELAVRVAVLGIIVAAAVNTVVKGGMATFIGGRQVGLRVGLPLLASAVIGLLAAWFMIW